MTARTGELRQDNRDRATVNAGIADYPAFGQSGAGNKKITMPDWSGTGIRWHSPECRRQQQFPRYMASYATVLYNYLTFCPLQKDNC
jgi:hypothetical protein